MAGETDTNQTSGLRWALFNLKLIGGYRMKRTIVSYVTMISMFFVIAFMVIDLTLNFIGIESLRRIVFLPSFFVSAIKGMFMIRNSKKLIDVVEDLTKFWRANKFDDETVKEHKIFVRKINLICGSYSSSAIAVCLLITLLPLLNIEARAMPYSDFTFCNLQSLYCWIPMWIWQFSAVHLQLLPSVLAFDCMFVSFVGYIMTACTLLNTGLQKLNTDNLQKRKYILKEIVNQHDFIMKFLKDLNGMWTIIMLLQFWCSLWSLILFPNMIIANGLPPKFEDVAYFGVLYAIVLFQLFIYATGGSIIEDRVKSVAMDMFMVNWYGRNRTDLRKDLTLMIFRAQRTKVLNVGKMSDLNYALFIATVKNSMSVFTLIWQLANQDTKH